MSTEIIQKDTTDKVLEKIEKGQISPHSKSYFRMRVILSVLLILAIAAVSVVLFSFIAFSIRVSDQATLLGFGLSGVILFLMIFPWKLLILDLVLVALLGYNLRAFKFGYSHPLIYIILILLVTIFVCGYIIDRETDIHRNLLKQADTNNLPFFNEEYRNIRRPPPGGHGFFLGTISDINDDMFIVELDNPTGFGTTSEVQVYISTTTGGVMKIGDRIFINGKRMGNSINASNIKLSSSVY